MRLIERTSLLAQLQEAKGTPDIKIITGVRRSGKSKLLTALWANYTRKKLISWRCVEVRNSIFK